MAGAGGLALLGGSSGLLAACAPTSSGSGGGDPESKTIKFYSWLMNEEASRKPLNAMIKAWSKQTGASVKTPAYPFNEYVKQMVLQVRGGQASGAAQVDIASLATFAKAGKLVDLGESAGKADYTPTALDVGKVDGKQLGLPWTVAAIGLIGNGKLLKQAGVAQPPATVDEFETVLEKLKKLGGVTPYAAMTKLSQLKDIMPWMWQFGSPVYDGKAVTLGDKPSVEAVKWYKSLLDRKLIAPDVDRFDARALFAQGKVGIYEDAIVGPGAVAASTKDTSLIESMTPMARPVVTSGDKPTCLAWGHAVIVFQGDGWKTAVEFAEHLTGDKTAALQHFKNGKNPPTTEQALNSPEVTKDAWTAQFTERITSSGQVNPFWAFPEYAQIELKLAEHVQRVLVGYASAQQALNDAKKEIEALVGTA
ncbi:MAG: ABC transporter substrate-binding protein [Dehalococcoidia bacterium]